VQLHLSDPAYGDRLAAFFESLGQQAHVRAPGVVGLEHALDETELAIYLRVWHVLYPDAIVSMER
jgi:hypothetical protein